MVQLRDYQEKGVAAVRGAFEAGAKAPAFVLPTGGGKTTMFGEMARRTVDKGRRVVILAHRRELINQAADRLQRFGLDPARVMPGGRPGDGRSFVASVQTLQNRLGEIDEPDLLIVDECHHAPAGSWANIRAAWPNARYVGFTATPIRSDGRGLREAFDTLVLGPTARWLTDNGFLVPCEILMPDIPDLTGVKRRMGEFDPLALAQALERSRVVGNAAATWRKHFPTGGRAVAFCCSVAHALHVATQFQAAGIAAAVLTGSDKEKDRDATLAALATGAVEVVCTVEVISEGFDLPDLDAIIWLRATESLGFWLQGCGRALRPAPGKTRALILDHVGNTYRHLYPDEPHEWTLDGRKAKPRAETHTEEGHALALVRCGRCFTMHPTAPVCPRCGTVHPPDERIPAFKAGQLRAISAEEAKARALAAKEAAAKARKAEEAACETMQDFIALGTKRHYADPVGWARVRFHLREKRKRRTIEVPWKVDADGWPL
jgi:superfamily II DNA or RNA helicase